MRQATESLENGAAEAARVVPGSVIGGRFRIESEQAREGGTVVYRAADAKTGAPWSLRIVPLGVIIGGADRVLAEVGKTQALRHKNLVEVEAVGLEGDFLFVATELVDGQSLREFIDGKRAEGRGISLKGASNLVAHVSNALEYAKRVTLHGALSPAVISVNRAGRVKVSALGLGSGIPGLARHGAPAGAPETLYVAPEVLAGGPTTPTSDVYSVGVILYELLTGAAPGSPFRPASTLVAEVPVPVDAVIARSIARSPDARWPSMASFKDALQTATGFGADSARHAGGAPVSPGTSHLAMPAVSVPRAQTVAAAPSSSPASPSARPEGTGGALSAPGPGATPGAATTAAPGPAPAAIGGLPEDNQERWLIQKDKLDFGPFSMPQIRAQIERGEILPEHVLVDNDSGARCRVKEYPGLGDLAKTAHRRIEQVRRAQAEQRSEKSEKKKSLLTTAIIGAVVLLVLAGVGFYVLSRRDSTGGQLASREEEAEIESFLKGVKIGGMKASVRRGGGAAHRAGPGAVANGSAEDFNNDSNFGDATRGQTEGDQTLDDDQIQSTMMANYRKLVPCIMSSGAREIAMEFVVRGTGKVSAVRVNGQRGGALPSCVLSRMQSFNFPKFNGSKTIASWSMSMGR